MTLSKPFLAIIAVILIASVIVGAAIICNDDAEESQGTIYYVSDFNDVYEIVETTVDDKKVSTKLITPGLRSVLETIVEDEPTEPITIVLTEDIYLDNNDTIDITAGSDVILKGNGHTIFRSWGNGNYLIEVYGTLSMNNVIIDGKGRNSTNAVLLSDGDLTIENSTIKNTNATMKTGGAIQTVGGKLTIDSSLFTNNYASKYGGAIHADGTTISINESDFTYNSTGQDGGAITVNNCTVTMTGVKFDHNSATKNGGAIVVGENNANYSYSSTVTATSCKYTNNSANNGGAIRVNSGTYTMDGGDITDNVASNNGGGVAVACNSPHVTKTEFVMMKGSFNNNSSNTLVDVGGGAIFAFNDQGNDYVSKTIVTINGGTLSGNSAYEDGGAVAVRYATLSIDGNTTPVLFDDNNALGGGAVYGTNSAVTIKGASFTNNDCLGGNGGAIDLIISSSLLLDQNSNKASEFRNNTSSAITVGLVSFGGNGGAIMLKSSTASIYGGIFDNNTASDPSIFEPFTTFRGNGGALALDGSASATLYGGTFTNNEANNGGALRIDGNSTVTFNENSDITMSENEAKRNGGAIAVSSGELTIDSGTITNNHALGVVAQLTNAGLGGAIHVFDDYPSTVTINSATIKGNTSQSNNLGLQTEYENDDSIYCPDDTQISILGKKPTVYIGDAIIEGSICLVLMATVHIMSDCPSTISIFNQKYSSIVFKNLEPVTLYGDIIGSAAISCNLLGLDIKGSITLNGVSVDGLAYTFKNETNTPHVNYGEKDVSVIVSYTPVLYDINVCVTANDTDGTKYRPSGATVTLAGGEPGYESGTGSDLIYVLEGVPYGITGDLVVSLAGYATYDSPFTFNNYDEPRTTVDIYENTVYGTVSFNGTAVPGATVILTATDYHDEVVTDDSGNYRFVRNPEGQTTLEAKFGDYIGEIRQIDIVTYDNHVDLSLYLNLPHVAQITINSAEPFVYTSTQITPTITVTLINPIDGVRTTLIEGTDYNVIYGKNVHVIDGGTIYVEGIGIFSGKISESFKITPKEVDAVWGNTELVYSGRSQVPSITATGIGGEDVDIRANCATVNINVGTYEAQAEVGNSDYCVNSTTQTCEFTIIPYEATVEWDSLDLEYNGTYQAPTAHAYGVIIDDTTGERENLALDIVTDADTTKTTIGTYHATASLAVALRGVVFLNVDGSIFDGSNYTLLDYEKEYIVHERGIEIIWANAALIYNGTAQVPQYAVNGAFQGDDLGITETGEQTNAGSGYTAEVTITNTNYIITGGSITGFSIFPRAIQLIWEETSFVYNGHEQIPSPTPLNVCDGDTVSFTVTPDRESIDIGSYTATAVFAEAYPNYYLDTATATTEYDIVDTLITGTVSSSGQPIVGAYIVASYLGTSMATYSNSLGMYGFYNIPSESDVTIVATIDGMYSDSVRLPDFDGNETADIEMHYNTVSGNVIGPNNENMTGYSVFLDDESGIYTSFTDAHGRFTFEGVVAGNITIDGGTYGYIDITQYTTEFAGGILSGINIHLIYQEFTVTSVTDEHCSTDTPVQKVHYLGNANVEFLADEGYHFTYYSVNGGDIILINGTTFYFLDSVFADMTVSVTTEKDTPVPPEPGPKTYVVLATASNGGTVTGTGMYAEGETATLVAVANEGYVFNGWSDGTHNRNYSIIVTDDIEIVAYFQVETVIADEVNPVDIMTITYLAAIAGCLVLIMLVFYYRKPNESNPQ